MSSTPRPDEQPDFPDPGDQVNYSTEEPPVFSDADDQPNYDPDTGSPLGKE